jgi:hypothetical protein
VTAATRLAEEKLAQKRENLETKSMGRAEAATRAHLRGVERQTKKDDDKLEKDAEKLEKAKEKARRRPRRIIGNSSLRRSVNWMRRRNRRSGDWRPTHAAPPSLLIKSARKEARDALSFLQLD